MEQAPANDSLERTAQRNVLIAALGEEALQLVTLSDSAALQEALKNQVGAKLDSPRRSELFPSIAALGGQTLNAVDLVLTIQDMVDQYQDRRGLVIRVIEDQMVPQYLSAITRDSDKSTRAALGALWRKIRDERYPEPESRYQKRMATKRSKAANSTSLRHSRNNRSRSS